MPDEYTYTLPAGSSEYTYSPPPQTDFLGGQAPPSMPRAGAQGDLGTRVESALNTFPHAVAQDIVGTGKSAWNALAHPIDTATNAYHSLQADAEERNKYADAAQAAKSKGDYAGMFGNTFAGMVPFVGPMVAKIADAAQKGDLDTVAENAAHLYTAAAMQKALPEVPGTVKAIPGAIKSGTTAGLDWAADASAPLALKAANAINAHPQIAKAAITAGIGAPAYLAGKALSGDVGFGGYGGAYIGMQTAKHIGNAVTDWASEYPEAASKLKTIQRAAQQRANPGVSLPEQAGVTTNPPVVAPPVEPIAGALPSGKVPGGIWNQEAAPAAPTPTVTTPSGPSPQLRAAIAKAVGPNGNVQRVLDDMIARGESDPYTGASLGGQSAPTTSAPPPTQPTPLETPTNAIPQQSTSATPVPSPSAGVLPHQIQPNSLVVDDIWRHATTGQDRPVSMMSTRGLAQFAKEQGIPVDQARQALEADNYTIPTSKELWQGLTSRGAEMGYNRQALYDKIQGDWGLERATDATTEELLKTYGDILSHPGPLSAQHIGAANYMLGDTGMQPVAPINLPINLRTQP